MRFYFILMLSLFLFVAGLSVSMASLYSEADLYRSSPKYGTDSNLTDSIMSAEGVALSLISRFSEKHLPRASELKWLVSEQDAPQRVSTYIQNPPRRRDLSNLPAHVIKVGIIKGGLDDSAHLSARNIRKSWQQVETRTDYDSRVL